MPLYSHVVEEDGELREVHAVCDLVEELEHAGLHERGAYACGVGND